jgi:hypothetical protein
MKEQGGIISDEVLVNGEARYWSTDNVFLRQVWKIVNDFLL